MKIHQSCRSKDGLQPSDATNAGVKQLALDVAWACEFSQFRRRERSYTNPAMGSQDFHAVIKIAEFLLQCTWKQDAVTPAQCGPF